jgi:uncharacterized protein
VNVHAERSQKGQGPARERRGVPAEAPVRIGHIVSVSGSHAVAFLERATDPAMREKDPRIQIGAIVKITTPASAVVGQVSAISAPMPEFDNKKEEIGLIEINLAGEICVDDESRRLVFRRGVPSPPSLGDPVYLADRHDLTRLYAPPGVASIKVGTVVQDSSVAARLLTDDLLAKHFVVVGTTGSGKSCALTCILQRLLHVHKAARIVILDIHNEYATAFGKLVEHISLESFNLPLWMLNFQELTVALTSTEGTRDEEIEILSEAVVFAKRRFSEAAAGRTGLLLRKALNEGSVISVDTPAPFRLSDVIAYIEDQLGKLERTRVTLSYRRLKARVETLVADKRYNFMFGGLTVQDTMTDVLSQLFRVPIDGRPISVIDLSTVPHEILDVVVSVISRLAFDLAVWSQGGLPMLIVAEEAHRYAPAHSGDKFLPTRQALARIAKEGRKFGISLALVTQRPSELDARILSQCSTCISLRLMNDRDQAALREGPYKGVLDLFDYLPLLGDREALILGQGVAMPMRIKFDDLGEKGVPKNMRLGFSKSWESQSIERAELDTIVTRWRSTGREEDSRGGT